MGNSYVTSDAYINGYINWLVNYKSHGKPMPIHPSWWAFHDYLDVWVKPQRWYNSTTHRYELKTFPMLKRFKNHLLNTRGLGGSHAKLRITEAGVQLHLGSIVTPLNGDAQGQRDAAQRFLDLNTVWSQTQLVSYWAIFGDRSFDTALVSPQYKPPPPLTLSGTEEVPADFRAAYCVLTHQMKPEDHPEHLCPRDDYVPQNPYGP